VPHASSIGSGPFGLPFSGPKACALTGRRTRGVATAVFAYRSSDSMHVSENQPILIQLRVESMRDASTLKLKLEKGDWSAFEDIAIPPFTIGPELEHLDTEVFNDTSSTSY